MGDGGRRRGLGGAVAEVPGVGGDGPVGHGRGRGVEGDGPGAVDVDVDMGDGRLVGGDGDGHRIGPLAPERDRGTGRARCQIDRDDRAARRVGHEGGGAVRGDGHGSGRTCAQCDRRPGGRGVGGGDREEAPLVGEEVVVADVGGGAVRGDGDALGHVQGRNGCPGIGGRHEHVHSVVLRVGTKRRGAVWGDSRRGAIWSSRFGRIGDEIDLDAGIKRPADVGGGAVGGDSDGRGSCTHGNGRTRRVGHEVYRSDGVVVVVAHIGGAAAGGDGDGVGPGPDGDGRARSIRREVDGGDKTRSRIVEALVGDIGGGGIRGDGDG